ncbi:MAG: NAD-dependent epimerase/dehydratase family protein [Eubacteriales bacterium]|nr:NAD-dependent epimerase/dehydratase family protein [Eubacteriales bacterium]
MKKALVIGGYGNIGLGVTKKLLEEGYDVTVLTAKERKENPAPEAKCIVVDRKDDEAFRAAVKDEYDYVIDFACMTKENARQDYEVFQSLKHMVAVSSGAAYGPLHGSEIPVRESMKLEPVWGYGKIKKEMENFFQQKILEENYPVTIFRPTVTYGRQKCIVRQIGSDNSWIDRIRKGKPIVTGNPYILRNFLHVDDAAGAFTGALKHERCKGQTYNLVGLRPYDWGEYHTAMMKVLGREVEMVEVPLSVLEASPNFQVSEMILHNFVYNGYYSGEKIARDIPEFCMNIDLETGLRMQVEYLERHNLIGNSDELTWEDELIRAQRKALYF